MSHVVLALLLAWSSFGPEEGRTAQQGAQQARAEQQRPDDTAPAASPLVQPTNGPDRAQEEADAIREDRMIARRLNYALVFATILTLLTLCYQSYWLRRDVQNSENAARIELRAYLRVSTVKINNARASVTVTNAGKTPGVEIRPGVQIYRGPKSGFNPDVWEFASAPRATLAPGGEFIQGSELPQLTDADKVAIANGDPDWVFVMGRLEYTDVFGQPRHTDYGFDVEFAQLRPPGGQQPEVNITADRNVAD